MRLQAILFLVLVGLLLVRFPVLAKNNTQEDELKKQADELTYAGQLNKANELLGNELKNGTGSSSGADGGWDMTSMMLSMIWGSIGVGYFIYGKKQAKALFLLCGIGLSVFPLFVSGTVLSIVLGMGLCILPFKVDF
ncbi:MAG TPA: hypothetical protein PLP29_05035 [Candidatus Ozemobacteraceae bacterium]|nr:hypothetical protein [Candidatus Ozemobacteraceae bacterium]